MKRQGNSHAEVNAAFSMQATLTSAGGDGDGDGDGGGGASAVLGDCRIVFNNIAPHGPFVCSKVHSLTHSLTHSLVH